MKQIASTMVTMLALISIVSCGGEGSRFAKEYWGKRMKDCGGSYVAYNPNPGLTPFSIMECKDPTITATESPLSDADKLNGFEWVGQTAVTCSSMRFKTNANSGPSQWLSNIAIASSRIWKKNGEWQVEKNILATEPTCSLVK